MKRYWIGAATAAVVLGGALWYARSERLRSPSALVNCLPRSGAVTMFVDFGALRTAGVLGATASSQPVEDADYRRFIDSTGFDYRRDLDRAAAAFSGRTSQLVLVGRFDWKRLETYATTQGGACNAAKVCHVPVSGGRHMSFYALRSDVMALAVSSNELAALDVAPRETVQPPALPAAPVWMTVAGPALRDVSAFPAGARSFVSPLEAADQVVFSAGSSNGKFEIGLDASCPSNAVASGIVARLNKATELLRNMLAREHIQPSPADLSGILVAGVFNQQGARVVGSWPLPKEFLETLAGGKTN